MIGDFDALFLQLSTQPPEKIGRFLPQIGTKLHSGLEQWTLLGVEHAQKFARKVARVMTNRVPANAPYAMRMVQTVSKSIGRFWV